MSFSAKRSSNAQDNKAKKSRTLKPKREPTMVHCANPPTLHHGQYTPVELQSLLQQHGYCVIENVLTPEKTFEYREQLYDAYHSLYDAAAIVDTNADSANEPISLGLDPRVPSTLRSDLIPPYKGNGIINVPSVGALQVSEHIRADPNVSAVFVAWHGTDALVTSFDRASLFAPNQPRGGLEPHIDANACRPEQALREATLQTSIILNDSAVPDQGFVVWPGHHTDPGKWNRDGDAADRNWCVVPSTRRHELGVGQIVTAKRGSQICWLSTTVHGNTSGSRSRDTIGRVAVFVSKSPSSMVSEEAWRKIVSARLAQETMSHDVITPAKLPSGSGRFHNTIKHRFASKHLATYATEKDIPSTLMKRHMSAK